MKKLILLIAIMATISVTASYAQFRLNKAIGASAKVVKAATITDEEVAQYVTEYIVWMDANNPVCEGECPYAVRLANITKNIKDESINIKAYRVIDVNAFACADGSIRVFAGLMDIMSDQEILGIVGHEIGHIKNSDSKDAFRTALLASALRDGVSAAGGTAAALSGSQLGALGEAVANSSFSQKQEHAADEFGYNFLKENNENPWAMAQSFEKLQKMMAEMGAEEGNAVQQLFSTHPGLDKRIERMTKKAELEGIARPIEETATAQAQTAE